VARGEGDFDAAIHDKTALFDGVDVVRVADDDLQCVLILREREDDVFAGNRLGHELDHRLRNGYFGQIDIVAAVLLGNGPHHVFARRIAELDDALGEAGILFLGDLPGLVELVLADYPAAEQDFGKITFACHVRKPFRDAVAASSRRKRTCHLLPPSMDSAAPAKPARSCLFAPCLLERRLAERRAGRRPAGQSATKTSSGTAFCRYWSL